MAVDTTELEEMCTEFSAYPEDASLQVRVLKKFYDKLFDDEELTVDNCLEYMEYMIQLFDTLVGLVRINRENIKSIVALSDLNSLKDLVKDVAVKKTKDLKVDSYVS